MNRTKAQREAIDTKEKNVLISAAAGSGKTSVLTERIVSLINGGADIRRMLVVTFTKKAAKEMKKRIRAGLMEAASDGNDPRLAIQAEETDSADISTIHTFATKIVKENFSELNLHARVHAAGEEQIKLFKAEAFEELIQECYENEDDAFLRLRDSYSGRTDDDLIKILEDVYSFCMSRPEGIGWLDSKGRPELSAYRETAFSFIRQDMKEMLRLSEKCMDVLDHGLLSEKREKIERENNAELKRLSSILENDPDRFRNSIRDFDIPKNYPYKGDDPNERAILGNYKKGMRGKLND
ncbi:MAG: UvrD-helicase domain-containing protein, partial [Clostridia bacterium]|nr:UvrD-helicase domain-containing protein [Clostridia bacterium]